MDSALVVKRTFFELQSATNFDTDACFEQTRPRAETDSIVDYAFGLAAEADGAKVESHKFEELSSQETSAGSISSCPSPTISWSDLSEKEEEERISWIDLSDKGKVEEDAVAIGCFALNGPPGCHMPLHESSQMYALPGFHRNATPMVCMMRPVQMCQSRLARQPSMKSQLEPQLPTQPTTLESTSQKRKKSKRVADTASKKQQVDISTTLVIRRLPKSLRRDDVARLLDSHGLLGLYNFLYTPVDFKVDLGSGFAIVNFEDESAARSALSKLAGCQIAGVELAVERSKAHRGGITALIERYHNSPLMDASMPDAYKPAFFLNGCRSPFPVV